MEDFGAEVDLSSLGLRVQGRKPSPLVFSIVRELGEEDLAGLQDDRGSQPDTIKKIRERHHALAKALVQGVKPGDAALMTGFSASRVSILQGDPTFIELLAFYRNEASERFYGAQENMQALSQDAVDELRDRLEENPEEISVNQLLDLAKFGMDRTGHGPSTKQEVNVRVGLAERLEAARNRAAASKMIDVTPKDVPDAG